MLSPHQIQSDQQRALIEALGAYPNVVIRPGSPPIAFELMGRLGLHTQDNEDKILVTSTGVRQLLSIQWSELRLAMLAEDDRTILLSNGSFLILQIHNADGPFMGIKPLLGRMMELPRPLPEPVKLPLVRDWYLGDIHSSDRSAYLLHLNDPAVYRYTLNIPYPYTPDDADQWLATVDSLQQSLSKPSNLAIRNPVGDLCGGIGFIVPGGPLPHQAEIGYWLAQPYWGKGVMTEAVRVFCHWIIEQFHFRRLTAHIFRENGASEKVLLKAGFQLEGSMTHHYLKDGVLYDGKLYALMAS